MAFLVTCRFGFLLWFQVLIAHGLVMRLLRQNASRSFVDRCCVLASVVVVVASHAADAVVVVKIVAIPPPRSQLEKSNKVWRSVLSLFILHKFKKERRNMMSSSILTTAVPLPPISFHLKKRNDSTSLDDEMIIDKRFGHRGQLGWCSSGKKGILRYNKYI